METKEIISAAAHLINLAFERAKDDNEPIAHACLVRLREFLNEQPELEAGG